MYVSLFYHMNAKIFLLRQDYESFVLKNKNSIWFLYKNFYYYADITFDENIIYKV